MEPTEIVRAAIDVYRGHDLDRCLGLFAADEPAISPRGSGGRRSSS